MKITVLGAGLVGAAITTDLAGETGYQVSVADTNRAALDALAPIHAIHADLSTQQGIQSAIFDSDLVICALPGFLGHAALGQIIEAGKNVVDISFAPEDPFLHDDLAKSKGVTAVVDCGVAPGLSNLIAGRLSTRLDRIDRFTCYVGGLPRVRELPYQYKAVFSPWDVLEEYTRPARYVEYGQQVVRPALSDVELLEFPGVGTLEAFNTDGLRSLMTTLDAPFMKEKTLRYPGHADLMRAFRETGLFSHDPIDVKGQRVAPIDITANLLFDQWRLRNDEEDLTVMRVEVEGEEDGHPISYVYSLLDHFDRDSSTTSMARTTGYTCAIVARLLVGGQFKRRGICPPEYIGQVDACYERILSEYADRNIQVTETIGKRVDESEFMYTDLM
jgi:saccharopine dehydrogenase-like NADP-dependent oxidoreductase